MDVRILKFLEQWRGRVEVTYEDHVSKVNDLVYITKEGERLTHAACLSVSRGSTPCRKRMQLQGSP